MSMPAVRWSTRLPWSSAVRLQRLVQLDAPGRSGDVLGRALAHLLDQADAVVLSLVQQVADARAQHQLDRTQVVSVRMDPGLLTRLQDWLSRHDGVAQSWLVDCAIRCYLQVCEGHTESRPAPPGMDGRRYRRLVSNLVVIVDEPHAA